MAKLINAEIKQKALNTTIKNRPSGLQIWGEKVVRVQLFQLVLQQLF